MCQRILKAAGEREKLKCRHCNDKAVVFKLSLSFKVTVALVIFLSASRHEECKSISALLCSTLETCHSLQSMPRFLQGCTDENSILLRGINVAKSHLEVRCQG